LTDRQVSAILSRRDAMQKHVQRMIRERGEAVTFLPAPAPRVARGSN
jgi:hypothetical protein